MKFPEFWQIGANNRETETTHHDELSTFEEERKHQEIRKKTRVMKKSYPILSENLGRQILHHLCIPCPHAWFSRHLPSHFP